MYTCSLMNYSFQSYAHNSTYAKFHFELNPFCMEYKLTGDFLKKVYSCDYISELLSHFNGVSILAEISEKYRYKIELLLTVVKGMILRGQLELILGNEEDLIVRIR
jgi:hypothetical protein